MKFAVVELKYVPGKTYIIPISWIKNINQKFKQTDSFLCYISLTISDEPNFDADFYEEEFNGLAGIYKVFVLKVTSSIEDAIIYQRKKNLKSAVKTFREARYTEAQVTAEQKCKRRLEKTVQKTNKRIAMMKNISYLSDTFTLYNAPQFGKVDQNVSCSVSSASEEDSSVLITDPPAITKQSMAIDAEVPQEAHQLLEAMNVGQEAEQSTFGKALFNELQETQQYSNIKYFPPKRDLLEAVNIGQEAEPSIIARSIKDLPRKRLKVSRNDIRKQPTTSAINKDQTVNTSSESTISTLPINTVMQVTDIPTISQQTIDTLEELQQQNNIIPTDHDVFKIVDSFENEMVSLESVSSQTITDFGAATGIISENTFNEQQKSTSGKTPCSSLGYSTKIIKSKTVVDGYLPTAKICDAAGCNVLKRKFEDLQIENARLQKLNDDLSKRNIALQDALVSTAKVVPPVPFKAKVKCNTVFSLK